MSKNQQPKYSDESFEKVHVLTSNHFTKTFKVQREIHNIIDDMMIKYN